MADDNEHGTSVGELNERIHQSPGQEITHLLDRLAGSRYIVEENHGHLHAAAKSYDGKRSSWFLDDPDGAKRIHFEYLRCLHNYLASLYTLYEHADTFQKRLDDEEIESEFVQKLAELGIPKRGDFLKGLRTYIQHRELLQVNLQEQFDFDHDAGEVIIERSLILNREELLAYDGWPNNRARTFVETLEEEIDLMAELDQYQEDITTLYTWLEERVRDRYSEALAEREELIERVQELHGEGQE